MASLTLHAQSRSFDGWVAYYSHGSTVCACDMRFAVYCPPAIEQRPVPVLYFLSGLTCTEENFMVKAGAQRLAAQYGIMLVVPDTSPRNTGIPDEDAAWDLGSGAGFYVDATQAPWSAHYRMYSYVTQELPELIAAHFSVSPDRRGIFGHSMGGHGALICALKNPQRYQSVSAFAPIAHPSTCPWGEKAFSAYLGSDSEAWQAYDATELIKLGRLNYPILIDQGSEDSFYHQKQLQPEAFQAACERVGQSLNLRFQSGYDHSYFMIATFLEDHLRHHAAALCDKP